MEALRCLDVVTGTLKIQRKIVKCLVIGESWPAWMSTACALAGPHNVTTYCGSKSGNHVGYQQVDWTDTADRVKLMAEWNDADVVFVSGHPKFLESWGCMGDALEKTLCAVDLLPGGRGGTKLPHPNT